MPFGGFHLCGEGAREGLLAVTKARILDTIVAEDRAEHCRKFVAGHGLDLLIDDVPRATLHGRRPDRSRYRSGRRRGGTRLSIFLAAPRDEIMAGLRTVHVARHYRLKSFPDVPGRTEQHDRNRAHPPHERM